MASKKTVGRRGSEKRPDAEDVLKLSRRAKAELEKLLKRNEDGTITRMQLDTGLEEIDEQLKQMIHFVRHLL
jgi:hypothetical protein